MTQAAVSIDIRTLLNDNALGTSATDLFSFEWGSDDDGEEIDQQTLVFDQEPLPTDLKELTEKAVFGIMVRGSKTEGGKDVYDRARAIWEFLIAQVTQTINTVDYLQFEPIGGMIPLGKDSNKRFVYSMNFYTFRDPS